MYKIKDLYGEKVIRIFYENELLLSKLQISFYPEPGSHNNTIKVVLNLSNYETKKELNNTTGLDTSHLAANIDFVALKAEDVNKLVNTSSCLNDWETKVDEVGTDKLKTVLVDLKNWMM